MSYSDTIGISGTLFILGAFTYIRKNGSKKALKSSKCREPQKWNQKRL